MDRPVIFRRLALIVAALAVGGGAVALVELVRAPDPVQRPDRSAASPQSSSATASSAAQAAFAIHDRPREIADIPFVDGDGRSRSLAAFRGKTVLLNIWATWCAPCRREMPTLDRLQAALGGDDFEVVALSIDRGGLETVATFYREVGVKNLAPYIDTSGKAVDKLGVVGLPTTLLIDRVGSEAGRLVGPAEWDAPDMVDLIRKRMSTQTGAATNIGEEPK